MKCASVLLACSLLNPAYAYADDATAVLTELSTRWQTAYNAGDSTKLGDLYSEDAVFSSGLLGTLKGRVDITKGLGVQMQRTPKVTITPNEAHIVGPIVYGIGEFTFDKGASGHYGWTITNHFGSWHILMHISNVNPK